MDRSLLHQLIRQPEGLKLEFKREFYHLDVSSPEGQLRQWGELIKDILALSNGNVNMAGDTGYLIIGIGDEVNPDGTRALYDVGEIKVTKQQILDKVNTHCIPPLPDIQCDLELLQGKRIFVISIPPTPYVHQLTKKLATSAGITYAENTVFIRRGEAIHVASIPEIQAIFAEKQRHNTSTYSTLPNLEDSAPIRTFSLPWRLDWERLVVELSFPTILLLSILLLAAGASADPDIQGFGAAVGGATIGAVFGILVGLILAYPTRRLLRIANQRAISVRAIILLFWLPFFAGILLPGMFDIEGTRDFALAVFAGMLWGLIVGWLLILFSISIRWILSRYHGD